MSAEYALANLKTNWEKIAKRTDDIDIEILGEPGKPYQCKIKVLTPAEKSEVARFAQMPQEDGTVKFDIMVNQIAHILQSLRDPLGEKIFNLDQETVNVFLAQGSSWGPVAAEIQDKQNKMESISAEQVKN